MLGKMTSLNDENNIKSWWCLIFKEGVGAHSSLINSTKKATSFKSLKNSLITIRKLPLINGVCAEWAKSEMISSLI